MWPKRVPFACFSQLWRLGLLPDPDPDPGSLASGQFAVSDLYTHPELINSRQEQLYVGITTIQFHWTYLWLSATNLSGPCKNKIAEKGHLEIRSPGFGCFPNSMRLASQIYSSDDTPCTRTHVTFGQFIQPFVHKTFDPPGSSGPFPNGPFENGPFPKVTQKRFFT